jgi:predicted nucleic acid-binding protein
MEPPRYVLDSNIIIKHLNNMLDINVFFDALPKCRRFISGVTEIEALSKPDMTDADIDKTNAFLLKFNKVNLLPAIKEISAAIRRVTKMELPDAVIAATSIVLSATLLSNDDHLLKLIWPGYTVQAI